VFVVLRAPHFRLQAAHQTASSSSSPPVTPERAPSDAAAEANRDAAATAAAAAQAAKLHSVAKKQKDKIAAQKEEIAELRQQVGALFLPNVWCATALLSVRCVTGKSLCDWQVVV
jgi:hypothetical protein